MNFKEMSKDELMSLYNDALDAYESGDEIMSDAEYDELVGYLGIENDADIGSQSKSEAYTVKHSFIMGSLTKVHTEQDKTTGKVNYDVVTKEVNQRLSYAKNARYAEFSPKLDGSSFSLETRISPTGELILSCASRGDGAWGIDMLKHMKNTSFNDKFSMLKEAAQNLLTDGYDVLVIRGEAIVQNSVYQTRYSNKFKNPRVFVSGNLNREFEEFDDEHADMCNDIHFICYDYRRVNSKTSDYQELSWMNPDDASYALISPYLGHIGENPDKSACHIVPLVNGKVTEQQIKDIYLEYADYRQNETDYALDGIVVKPECSARNKNLDRYRPQEMIAIKFIAEKMQSTIVDIIWNVGQTGELTPVGIVEPVYQDGKKITQTSLHGYSYLLNKHVGIGSEVVMVMNGDIVPGVYEVLSEGEIKMPDFETTVKYIGKNNTPHLMKVFTGDEFYQHKFRSSAKVLKIDGIKEKTAEKIWFLCHSAYEEVYYEPLVNLMQLIPDSAHILIEACMGKSKSTSNIIKSLNTYHTKMNLGDIIRGMIIENCGETTSEICAKIISGQEPDTSGIQQTAYDWAYNHESENYLTVLKYMSDLNVKMYESVETTAQNGADVEYVILTGSPKEAGYATKKDWLNAHPNYIETKKWNECTMLVTNNLESTTDKMAKATKLGIKIVTY